MQGRIKYNVMSADELALFTDRMEQLLFKRGIRMDHPKMKEELEKAGYECKQTEGYHSGNWILLDFNDVIIHIFNHEDRLFYDLERIWRDGKSVEVADLK